MSKNMLITPRHSFSTLEKKNARNEVSRIEALTLIYLFTGTNDS
jgi:hypothetical protein